VGVIEKRDFTLSLTDEETLRRPRLPFWHIDYFTQPQLDDPEFFLVPDWPLPRDLGPPVDVLGMPDTAAVVLRPARLCPSPPPERVEDNEEETDDEEEANDGLNVYSTEVAVATDSSIQSVSQHPELAESSGSMSQPQSQHPPELGESPGSMSRPPFGVSDVLK